MKILSFIIPSYNCERFLDKCLTSFLDEEVIDKLDVIVVNDGSKDSTPEVAQKYCDRYPGSIRLINQENKGHCGALNTGCAAATGKYLKVIDADDWVDTVNLKLSQCSSRMEFLKISSNGCRIDNFFAFDDKNNCQRVNERIMELEKNG